MKRVTEANAPDGQQFAHITFRHGETAVMMGLPMPPPGDFRYNARGNERSVEVATKFYDQEKRRRWRALLLVVKAKLEAVQSGISTLEREFFSDIVLPNGRTLSEAIIPMLGDLRSGRLALPERTER